jgi:phage I-like protein
MGKKSAPEKRSKSRHVTASKPLSAHKSHHSDDQESGERFRISPMVIRLTEGRDGVHVPEKIQLFRVGTFKKLMPGGKSITFSITRETLEEIIENWKANVRGTDLALDFAHKSDEEAAAWFTDLTIENGGRELWAEVEWTPDGYAAVEGKKFRYISPDFVFGWRDNETGKKYGATLFGAGLTNRPVIKNMAPTVELTEVTDMAKTRKTAPKKISELTKEELEIRLADETDEEKREFIELRLEEMTAAEADDAADEDDADEEDDAPPADKKKPKKPLNLEEMTAAYEKVCAELADIKKGMSAQLAETRKEKKEASFSLLCAEGKAVPAQKKAFMADDMVTFANLAEKPKFTTIGSGGNGGGGTAAKTTATDEVLKLAEEAVKAGRATKRADAISIVLSEKPELNARYQAEMEGEEPQEVDA